MILVDANLLLYAYHPQADQHEKSRAWLEVQTWSDLGASLITEPELIDWLRQKTVNVRP